jgi:hypothetical protein
MDRKKEGFEAAGALAVDMRAEGSGDQQSRGLPLHIQLVFDRMRQAHQFIMEVRGQLGRRDIPVEMQFLPLEEAQIHLERHGDRIGRSG